MKKNKVAITASITVHTGTYGNVSAAVFEDTLSNNEIDTVIELGTIPAGAHIDGIEVHSDALGAGSSLDFGVQLIWDQTKSNPNLFGSVSTETEGYKHLPIKPFDNGASDLIVTATVKGAPATGHFLVKVNYRYVGVGQY